MARTCSLRRSPVRRRILVRMALAALYAGLPSPSWAQGGPPLVSDDPDTAPDGHWEINLAAIGNQTPGLKQLSLPDADINYGWGANVQLKIDTPWILSEPDGHAAQSGLGATQFGIKWRFVDQRTAGFSLSTYPQVTTNLAPSSYRRGITGSGEVWFLPLEASIELAGFGLNGELGRYVSSHAADAWAAGFVASRGCAARLECLVEIRETLEPHSAQTLLNLGGRRELGDSLALLFALGRDFGPPGPDHQTVLFYFGLQVRR
jgi:hypothetical protein